MVDVRELNFNASKIPPAKNKIKDVDTMIKEKFNKFEKLLSNKKVYKRKYVSNKTDSKQNSKENIINNQVFMNVDRDSKNTFGRQKSPDLICKNSPRNDLPELVPPK